MLFIIECSALGKLLTKTKGIVHAFSSTDCGRSGIII